MDPQTKKEWQEAVDAAYGLLCLDAARSYGLLAGGPTVNTHRCEEIIRLGEDQGVRPREEKAVRNIAEFA